MYLHNRIVAGVALVLLSIVSLTACTDGGTTKAAPAAPAVTSLVPRTPVKAAVCPYTVQKNGTCQALISITTVSFIAGAADVSFNVKNLTGRPLVNLIVDAEAFTSGDFKHKVGQTSMFHQTIPAAGKQYTIKLMLSGKGNVMTASVFGAANTAGVFGSGKSNFARTNG